MKILKKQKKAHLQALCRGQGIHAIYHNPMHRDGYGILSINNNMTRLYRRKQARDLLQKIRTQGVANNTRAGVDHDVQLNVARQPVLQVHDVQPADNAGAHSPPPPPQVVDRVLELEPRPNSRPFSSPSAMRAQRAADFREMLERTVGQHISSVQANRRNPERRASDLQDVADRLFRPD